MPPSSLGRPRCLASHHHSLTAPLTRTYAARQQLIAVLRRFTAPQDPCRSDQQCTGQPSSGGSMSQGTPTVSVPHTAAVPAVAAAIVGCAGRAAGQEGWSHAMMAYYLAADRNWKAVEDFYIRLVSGTACLSQLGLAPAGAPAAVAVAPAISTSASSTYAVQDVQKQDVQQSRQQQGQESKQQQDERKTFKVCVSYLGSSFAGWARQPGRRSVEETLASAVAAAGLTGGSPGDKNSKRAAARAARRRAQSKAENTTGDVSTASAGPTRAASSDAVHPLVSDFNASCSAAAAAGASGAEQTIATTGTGQLGRLSGQAVAQAASSVPAAAAAAAAAAATAAATAGGGGGAATSAVTLPALAVAGRTDAGVTAIGQVICFHRYGDPLPPDLLLQLLNTQLAAVVQAQEIAENNRKASSAVCDSIRQPAAAAAFTLPVTSQLRAWSASEVPRHFHATFSASWRRYTYLVPLKLHHHARQQQPQQPMSPGPAVVDELTKNQRATRSAAAASQLLPLHSTEIQQALQRAALQDEEKAAVQQAPDIKPDRVNALLQQLQGCRMDYSAYARDTPKGKGCHCTLHEARASLVHIPVYAEDGDEERKHLVGVDAGCASHQQYNMCCTQPCLCIELVGDRFLRRMVRVLVATAIRESLQGPPGDKHQFPAAAVVAAAAGDDSSASASELHSLVQLAELCDRNKTAAAAPGLGLCFAAAGYKM